MHCTYKEFAAFAMCILIGFIVGACANSDTVMDAEETGERKILFEMVTDRKSEYPEGETLTLRVFSDTETEFDYFPSRGLAEPTKPEAQRSSISKAQLKTFKSLMAQLDSQSPEKKYFQTKFQTPRPDGRAHIDAPPFIEVTISYLSESGMKQIVIQEQDNKIDTSSFALLHYPSALVELMRLSNQISDDKRKDIFDKRRDNKNSAK